MFGRKRSGSVLKVQALNMHWDTEDPFFFVSHHCDDYPKGNAQQAPPLEMIGGRNLGRDYKKLLGFRMYHGKVVPGFPLHAHWGYETVTMVSKGYVDHSDSLGIEGRYGAGDVQWISAGDLYVHNEMYPLVHSDNVNPNEITQIMINLPLKDKGSVPEVRTIWSEDIPIVKDEGYVVKVIAGEFNGISALSPNAVSWASDPDNHVRILRIFMDPAAELMLSPIKEGINRNLYTTEGNGVNINGEDFDPLKRFKLSADEIIIRNGDAPGVLWLLEGRPINEKMSSFGPIVLDTDKNVREALNVVRKEELERWSWGLVDRTQPKGTSRFIRYKDGREEFPPSGSKEL